MKNKLILILAFVITLNLYAQNGYIYVHKKATSELASVDFSFNLKQGATNIKSFNLNDQPNALNSFDLGNSHGTGEGQLWAVVNDAISNGSVHDVTGTLYTRAVNATNWTATSVVTARSVDGIGTNSAVYSDDIGAVYIYNGTSFSKIWEPTAHSNIRIVDVASGGDGKTIVAVGSGGKIYKYTGSGTTDSWIQYSSATIVNAIRADINPTPTNQEVVFVSNNDTNVYKFPGDNTAATVTIIPALTDMITIGSYQKDVAVSNDGTIYSNFTNSEGTNVVFEYTAGGGWINNVRSRGLTGLTAGVGNQVWGINKVNADIIKHTIFSRLNSGLWLDDERLRTNVANGNSIMIPVSAGTYTLSEIDVAGWNNNNILIYDPTTNSSSDVSTSTATINVAAGEVVHVVYGNALENSIVSPSLCSINNILTFGQGTSDFGPAISGFTSYHYLDQGFVSDGYYSLAKNSANWTGNTTLLNHTSTEPNGYFAIFNASYATDDFFRQTVTGLSIGTTYDFSFWVADLSPNVPIRPNITMGIADAATGVLLNSINTGDISTTIWKQYTFTFTATSTVGEIFLKNNSIGGSGNDLAIDDVTFAPSPIALPAILPAGAYLCSSKSVPDTYTFSNGQLDGVWSTDQPSLLNINSVTGVATTIYGATGTANIIYTYTSSSGCTSVVKNLVTVGNCVCYDDANKTAPGSAVKQGVTLLQRAGTDNGNWPMIRKSGFTALESNTKGFVITRATTTEITNIVSPQDGMMVYDTVAKCLKLYDGSTWSCFVTPTCP
ncbi:carbohydrate binding domain-containing protein [Frigoriflavimonas asaccharolytica]|uniref:CBM-cenC domain-containing protein n=1 Tax=Frigoriflavimonas asaccharolytica TaxID=2735899 RepID=A0A8J8GBI9_9FLAO|nr:carbohydrate binding domain-containing protein [Frigoriflavimonas asaccharolytica]NRS93179.1 hypothetical protein [Frigoriflavimonas asaccharolytica]